LRGAPETADHAPVHRHELLERVPLFRGLSEEARISLSERLVARHCQAGELVFSKGDTGSAMFLLLSGKVEIFLPPEGSVERVVLRDLVEGEHFGELALFDEKPRSASAEAKTDCELLELSREHFISDIVRSEAAVLAILSEMAVRLRDTNSLLSQRAAKDVVKEFEENLSWRDKLADRVADLNGSWTFILALLALTLAWAGVNAFVPRPFDAYPYQFFNLFLGILVGVQGPLIMMSQNRQARKDRAQASTDFRVNLKNEVGIESLGRELLAFRKELEERMVELERAQLEITSAVSPSQRSARASSGH
jgi:CRP/FNR family cyclic AMP-dependent transcriptional regulator